jgi:hypothetical protein
VTHQEVNQYLGRQVEVRLTTGLTLVGRLVSGTEASLEGTPYAIESPRLSPPLATSETTYSPVTSAAEIEWVRVLSTPLSEDRIED